MFMEDVLRFPFLTTFCAVKPSTKLNRTFLYMTLNDFGWPALRCVLGKFSIETFIHVFQNRRSSIWKVSIVIESIQRGKFQNCLLSSNVIVKHHFRRIQLARIATRKRTIWNSKTKTSHDLWYWTFCRTSLVLRAYFRCS